MSYTAYTAHFNAATFLARGGDLTGVPGTSTRWTGSCWVRRTGGNGLLQRIRSSTNSRNQLYIDTSDRFALFGRTTTNSTCLQLQTSAISDTDPHHFMWSFDLSDATKRHLYRDGAPDLNVALYDTAKTIDFTDGDAFVGGRPDGGLLNADVADLQEWIGLYVDLSVVANWQLFRTGDGSPADPAIAAAALGSPIVLLSGPTADWHTNKGTGGGFTLNGTLTDGAPIGPGEPTPLDLPWLGRYYGAATFGYTVGNTRMRGVTDHFFYAERNGTINRARLQRRTGSGYSAGTGGTYTIAVLPADPLTKRGIVGATAVSSVTGYAPGNPGVLPEMQEVALTSTPGQVIAGQPYVLRFTNTHATPLSNFVSQNVNWQYNGSDPTPPSGTDPRNVGASPVAVSGWSPVWIDDKEWYPYPTIHDGATPRYLGQSLVGVRYSDGVWAGFNFQSSEQSGAYEAPIGNPTTNMARVRFTVSRATRVVDGVFLRVVRYNSTTGNLVVTLESGPASATSGNGSAMTSVTVSSTVLYNVGADEDGVTDQVHWFWVPFTSNWSLTLGVTHTLRLSATGSLDARIWGNTRGENYFASGNDWTAWEDSLGHQRSTNSGSSWSYGTGPQVPVLFRCV